MIQAIVFLPLLGAILAGVIALAGAMRATRAAIPSSMVMTITRMGRTRMRRMTITATTIMRTTITTHRPSRRRRERRPPS